MKVLLGDLSWSDMVWSWSQIGPPIDENMQTRKSHKRENSIQDGGLAISCQQQLYDFEL